MMTIGVLIIAASIFLTVKAAYHMGAASAYKDCMEEMRKEIKRD